MLLRCVHRLARHPPVGQPKKVTPAGPPSAHELAKALNEGEHELIVALIERFPVDRESRHRGIDGPRTPTPSLVARLIGFSLAATADTSDDPAGDRVSAECWFDTVALALEKGFSPFHLQEDRKNDDDRGHAGAAVVANLRDIHDWKDATELTWEIGWRCVVLLETHGVVLGAPIDPSRSQAPTWRSALTRFPSLRARLAHHEACISARDLNEGLPLSVAAAPPTRL